MYKMDDAFILYASNILGATDGGLSGSKIKDYCCSYAITFNKRLPIINAPNKRTSLKEYLGVFEASEQFRIIKDLCELPELKDNEQVKKLKITLYSRYRNLAQEKLSETELIETTRHWLSDYPRALKQYESALAKFEGGIFERNTLDDMRLSFELLVKGLLQNEKSLENQLSGICTFLKDAGASQELIGMIHPIIKYYTDFQNQHVKHNDKVNSSELEYVIELTSVIMRFLIKVSEGKNNG